MGRKKNHRQWLFGLGERLLQLQSAGSRHLQIEHRTTGGIRTATVEEFFRRTKAFNLVLCGLETAGQRAEKRRVVIHQIDDRHGLTLDLALAARGFVGHVDFSSFWGPSE